jgi:hypothetical protein
MRVNTSQIRPLNGTGYSNPQQKSLNKSTTPFKLPYYCEFMGPPFPTHRFANIHSSFATIYTPLYFNYTHLLTLITGTSAMLLPPRCHYLTVAVARKPWLIPRPYILIKGNFGVFMGERSAAKILTACLILYSSSAK